MVVSCNRVRTAARVLVGIALLLLVCRPPQVEGRPQRYLSKAAADAAVGPAAVFDVTKYGAKGNGKPQVDEYGECANTMGFMHAWNAACQTPGPSKVLVPAGKFVLGQVIFAGPCKPGSAPVIELKGTMLAMTDLSQYPSPEWILFENVNGLLITGNGTLNGQGSVMYHYNDCLNNPECSPLPSTIKFNNVTNSAIEKIKSTDSMFYHISLEASQNISIHDVKLTAIPNSPNTDGVHVESSSLVSIANSIIGTGADCVSLGPGSTGVSVSGVTCGPGLGISISGLGKEAGELEVKDVLVKTCKFKKTVGGVSIRTVPGASAAQVSGIWFEDLHMDGVKSPIVIDQGKDGVEASHVKIKDVTYKNIKGTTASDSVVSLVCSKMSPCEGIQINNVNVKPSGPVHKLATTCLNAKVLFQGKNNGLAC